MVTRIPSLIGCPQWEPCRARNAGHPNNSRCGRDFLAIVNNLFEVIGDRAIAVTNKNRPRGADEFAVLSIFQTTNRRPSQCPEADHAKTNPQMMPPVKDHP